MALNGSNSHNGTRGHATSPNLEGIMINQAPPAVNYIMDEPVIAASTAAASYSVTLQDGTTNPNPGGGVTFSGDTVTVRAAAGTSARRATRSSAARSSTSESPRGPRGSSTSTG